VFRQGDVPAGQSLALGGAVGQGTVKSTYPDGSARMAIIAGTFASTAGVATTVSVSPGAGASGAALRTADLRAAMTQPVSVAAGAFGSASFSGADWDSPFATWVSGPIMSSWIYRKPMGTDAHLVAWLEVRMWNTGQVEVLPWVENGYLRVAAPTNKSTTYSVTMGGSSRFSGTIDLKHHQRTPLVSGTRLAHWLAADPDVIVRHAADYMMATEQVPTYRSQVPAGGNVTTLLPNSFTPLQQGTFTYTGDRMSAPGYSRPIGLLPTHDALYLTCHPSDAARAYKGVVWNGYSAGRYATHYRDETTQRPPAFSAYPTLVLAGGASSASNYTPTPSGGEAPERDIAHHPSVGYMAYLVTGRWYFMEEALFSSVFNHFAKTDTAEMRDRARGLVKSLLGGYQTRAAAWSWRTLLTAYAALPDDDTVLRTEYRTVVQANIDHFHGRYVGQENNVFGLIEPGEAYGSDDQGEVAIWQQDFFSAATGWGRSMALNLDTGYQSKLAQFHDWNAKGVINRLGSFEEWWYINAAPYTLKVSGSKRPDYITGAGPFYTLRTAYAQTYTPTPSWMSQTEGRLASEFFPENRAINLEPSTWHNIQPAIAYAVRHRVPGALDAYNRMVNAANWNELEAGFNAEPVWAIRPADGTWFTPNWLSGAPLHRWVEISGTSGAALAQVDPWGAFAVTPDGRLLVSCSGGHNDSADNRVVSINLMDDSPNWEILQPASASFQENVSHYAPDGHPTSRHNYLNTFYVPALDRIFHVGSAASYGGPAPAFASVDAYRVTERAWDRAGTYAPVPEGNGTYKAGVVWDGVHVWSNTLRRFNPVANRWSSPITSRINPIVEMPWAFDSRRRQLFGMSWGTGTASTQGPLTAAYVPIDGNREFAVQIRASTTRSEWESERHAYAGMDYDPINDRFLFYSGQVRDANGVPTGLRSGKVYVVKPNNTDIWDMSLLSLAGTVPTETVGAGINGRFKYVPRLKGFVLLPQRTSNLWFFRVG
jgi:hypothetical protein